MRYKDLVSPVCRTALLNAMIRENNFKSYLEIGCRRNRNFDLIECAHKVGVDPKAGGTLRMTSDDFFAVNQEVFDLIFIDGLHLCEQVTRDVMNALNWISYAGFIVLHDCLPKQEHHQVRQQPERGAWTGDVWKAAVNIRTWSDVDFATLDENWGLGVIKPNTTNTDLLPLSASKDLYWSKYEVERDRLLRAMPVPQFLTWLRGK